MNDCEIDFCWQKWNDSKFEAVERCNRHLKTKNKNLVNEPHVGHFCSKLPLRNTYEWFFRSYIFLKIIYKKIIFNPIHVLVQFHNYEIQIHWHFHSNVIYTSCCFYGLQFNSNCMQVLFTRFYSILTLRLKEHWTKKHITNQVIDTRSVIIFSTFALL